VGVAADVHHHALDDAETLQLYVPSRRWFYVDQGVDVVVRTAGDPARILPALRQAALAPDPETVITRLSTMTEVREHSVSQRVLVLGLFAAFAAVALLLAAAGLFGSLAGAVTERRREIGVRSALGASRRDIIGLVARQGFALAGTGTALGLVVTLAGAGAIRSLLFGVGTRDVLTIGAAAAVIGVTGILAGAVPAWRALRVDPMTVLRAD